MEIVLCVFLGVWISGAGVCALFWLKREFNPYMRDRKSGEASDR